MPYALNAIITCSMRGPLRIYGAGSHHQGECCADWHFMWRQTRWEHPVTAEQCTQAPEMSPSSVPSPLTVRWHYTMHTTTLKTCIEHTVIWLHSYYTVHCFSAIPHKAYVQLAGKFSKALTWNDQLCKLLYSLCSVMYSIGNVIVLLCDNLRHSCICGMMCL